MYEGRATRDAEARDSARSERALDTLEPAVGFEIPPDAPPRKPRRRRFERAEPASRPAVPSSALADLDPDSTVASRPMHEGARAIEALGRDALHRRLLATADAASAALAVTVAILAGGAAPKPAVLAMLPLIVLVSKIVGLYDRDEHVLHKTTLDEVPALLNLAIAGTLIAWLLEDAVASAPLGKGQVLLMFGLFALCLALGRTLARRVAQTMAPPERLLVLGRAPDADRISAKLAELAALKATVVGRVPIVPERRAERGSDVLGSLGDLDRLLAANRIDRVVICPHGDSSSDMLDTIRLVKELGVRVSVMPRMFEVMGSSVEFDELGGLILLGLRRYDLTKSSAFLKRALDVAGASAILLVLAPLLAIVSLAIKLTSPGPVFFRQPRVGRGGRPFHMLKFRTMYDGADRHKADLLHRNEADGFFKIAADPRVTPIGRWLRRCSLDELPQLIHVLRGEMSLVGPRPLVAEEDSRIEGWFRRRLDVKPGMTGAWQVLGSSRVPMRDMVTIDYLYGTNWSLWLDVKILLRTATHVVRRRGI
ncbi:MAG TPA: sugar transferase [Thermoleophilaceae bacterium]